MNGVELINHRIICQIIEKSIKLSFEKHISNTCKKARNQLNAICRLKTFIGHKKRSNDKYFRAFKFQLRACLIWLFSS